MNDIRVQDWSNVPCKTPERAYAMQIDRAEQALHIDPVQTHRTEQAVQTHRAEQALPLEEVQTEK